MLAEKNRKISNSLKKKFLYNNDINSIHILLNLYESEDNIGNIFPRYISLGSLRKIVKKQLRGREGSDLAAKNISESIHNDFNRFELLFYLEAYKSGYKATHYANSFEKIILKTCEVEQIYSKSLIREKLKSNMDANKLKEEITSNIKSELTKSETYKKFVYTYNRKIIKPKIYNINRYLDKQLKMEQDSKGKTFIKYDGSLFNKKELNKLYNNLVLLSYEDGIKTLIEGYWSGLIENVLRRYK